MSCKNGKYESFEHLLLLLIFFFFLSITELTFSEKLTSPTPTFHPHPHPLSKERKSQQEIATTVGLTVELSLPFLLLMVVVMEGKQTCLPQNISVCTPNSLCPYFRIFDRIIVLMHPPISQNEAVSMVNFSIIRLVRAVCELAFSVIQAHYARTTLLCLHLRKSFSIEDRRTLSPKTMHRVSCFC